MTDIPLTHALRGLALVPILFIVVWTSGCADAVDNGRHTLAAVAVATEAADLANAARIRAVCGGRPAIDMTDAAAIAARAGEIAECVESHGFVRVITAIDAVDATMLHVQERLDQMEASGIDADVAKRRVREVLACVRAEVAVMLGTLDEAGVQIPDSLHTAVALLSLLTGTCVLDEVQL